MNDVPALPETWRDLRFLLRADFYRYDGAKGFGSCLKTYLLEPGAQFTFWLRVSSYLRSKPLLKPFYAVAWWMRRHYEIKYGIEVPSRTLIGPGLYFGHCGGIVINSAAVIGRNCNVSHDVTIGQTNRGSKQGCPTIGDDVYVGPGAKIVGRITIGSRAAIGANAVVTSDVPAGAVAAGIPARVISMSGSEGYIEWTDYPSPQA